MPFAGHHRVLPCAADIAATKLGAAPHMVDARCGPVG